MDEWIEDVYLTETYDTVLHTINIEEIIGIIDPIHKNIQHTCLQKTQIWKMLLDTIKTKALTLITHRQRRGLINIFRTAHRWLFGTMNDNDRQEIK